MKFLTGFSSLGLGLFTLLVIASCGNSSSLGQEVNGPFTGAKYETSKRYYRAVGNASSQDENQSKSKANLQAKKDLAQQVQATLRVASEKYSSETGRPVTSELNDKFIELARQVTRTEIPEIKTIGEKTVYDAGNKKYTTSIALEIHRKDLLRFLKRKADADASIGKNVRRAIERILENELKKLED